MSERLDPPWMSAPETRAVIAALEAKGGRGTARFVGGCVRDALLGRRSDDVDLATRLVPEETIEALEAAGLKAIPTGVEHGTVTAVAKGRPFEITTLRRDVETDGRRAVVAFTGDWAEDAARRDFRLNALYLDPDGTLHDPTGGGIEDARAGRIIFVGDPETRIREDYLRVLRFFRFFAWFGRGEADAAGLAACRSLAAGVAALSGERLSKELLKLLAAPDPRPAVRLMQQARVLSRFLPPGLEMVRFAAMVPMSTDPELRLAALLPSDRPLLIEAAHRLRLSSDQAHRLTLAASDDRLTGPGMDPPAARRAVYELGGAVVLDRALLGAAGEGDPGRWETLRETAETWAPPRFPAKGSDLTEMGLSPGPDFGRLLRAAEGWWIDQDFRPDRAAVLARIRAMLEGEA